MRDKERHDGRALTTALDRYVLISLLIINSPQSRARERLRRRRSSLQALVSYLSSNSSYYCYAAETENLLILISISHQGSEQLQSHLKAIDCGFRSSMSLIYSKLQKPLLTSSQRWSPKEQEVWSLLWSGVKMSDPNLQFSLIHTQQELKNWDQGHVHHRLMYFTT